MEIQNAKGVFGMILAYNCAPLLEQTYNGLQKNLFEAIIVIDDGSTDDVLAVAQRLGIPAYTHAHGGYGSNLKFGLKKAVELGAEIIVEIHGDGQFASSIPQAVAEMRKGCDLVLGNRFYEIFQPLKDNMSVIRYFGNYLLSLLGRVVMGVRAVDLFTGFRVYSRRLVQTCDFSNTSDDYFFSFEIIVLTRFSNLRIGQVPARCFYGKEHTSISLWKGFLEIGQTPHVLLLYVLARLGIRQGIFARPKSPAKP